MKKAQGLPISTIIIAALGILVLVVIGAIFGGQIGEFGRAAKACPGNCVKKAPPLENRGLFAQRSDAKCDPEFETTLYGAYVPKGMPKDKDAKEYRCDSCCVATG